MTKSEPLPERLQYVSASIQAMEPFDESEWDPYLATLRYEKTSADGAAPS